MVKYLKAVKAQKKLRQAEKLIAELVAAGRLDGAAGFYGVNDKQLAVSVDGLAKCGAHLADIHSGLNGLASTSTDPEVSALSGPNKDEG